MKTWSREDAKILVGRDDGSHNCSSKDSGTFWFAGGERVVGLGVIISCNIL